MCVIPMAKLKGRELKEGCVDLHTCIQQVLKCDFCSRSPHFTVDEMLQEFT